MKARLPFGLKLLRVSAYLVCTLALIECGMILWATIKNPPQKILPVIINITVFAVFFTFSILLIRILNSYYPAGEVPRSTRVFFRIISVTAWIFNGFFLIMIGAMVADDTYHPTLKIIFQNMMTAILFLSFLGAYLLQVLNSILASGLIRRINKNHRQQMFESI